MTRYRIVQRPSITDRLKVYFHVEKRVRLFFWKEVRVFYSLDDAEQYARLSIRADEEKSYPKARIIKKYK